MMPHISLTPLLLRDPVFESPLLPRADCQRAGRHVFTNRRAAADVRPFADRDRSDELRITADERPVFDRGLVLVHAVVVAGDGAGADVDLRADLRVAEIGEMHRLGTRTERGLFQLHEVADTRAVADDGAAAKMRKGTDLRVRRERRLRDDAVIVHGDAIADRRVDDSDAAVDLASRADRRGAFDRDTRMYDRIGTDAHTRIDVRRRRILDRDAGRHEFRVLSVSHDSAYVCKLSAAV